MDFHEPGFAAGVNAENRFTLDNGFQFQLGRQAQRQAKYQGGPANPQALNRYSYTLNNPVRYVDPTGHNPLAIALGLNPALLAAAIAVVGLYYLWQCASSPSCRASVAELGRRALGSVEDFIEGLNSLTRSLTTSRYYVPPGLDSEQRNTYRDAVHRYKRMYGLGAADNVPKEILDQIADAIKDGSNAYNAAIEADEPPEGDDPDYEAPSRRGRNRH